MGTWCAWSVNSIDANNKYRKWFGRFYISRFDWIVVDKLWANQQLLPIWRWLILCVHLAMRALMWNECTVFIYHNVLQFQKFRWIYCETSAHPNGFCGYKLFVNQKSKQTYDEFFFRLSHTLVLISKKHVSVSIFKPYRIKHYYCI